MMTCPVAAGPSAPRSGANLPITAIIALTLAIARPLLLVALNLTVLIPLPARSHLSSAGSSTETLLGGAAPAYGTFPAPADGTATPTTDGKAQAGGKEEKPQSWSFFFARLKTLSPYLWPKTSPKLQAFAALCIIIIILGRSVNAATPLALGRVVDDLTTGDCESQTRRQAHARPAHTSANSMLLVLSLSAPWKAFTIYVALRFASGSGGILVVLQSMLWGASSAPLTCLALFGSCGCVPLFSLSC